MRNTGEFNVIKINNPDGFIKGSADNGLRLFNNEGRRFVGEAPMRRQTEVTKTSESPDMATSSRLSSQPAGQNSATLNNNLSPDNLSSMSSAATNAATGTTAASGTAASGAAASGAAASGAAATGAAATGAAGAATAAASAVSVTASVGGAIGAVAGVVATSVATAVLVVAVFISTLTINVSLVMADLNKLVFQIELQGAQEEDFINPIMAVLKDKDGTRYEQQILPDSLYLTFEDLTPDTEYILTISNEEKVFVEKSFLTAKEKVEKGTITAYYEEHEVFITVENVLLKSKEFYTVTVKDEDGKVVFSTDSAEPDNTFRFTLARPKNLYFSLSVSGNVYSVYQIEMLYEPIYNYDAPVWAWNADNTATVTFTEKNGGDPLVIIADVVGVYTNPACEVDGYYTYTATATHEDKVFSDVKVVQDPGTATGHDFSHYNANNTALQPEFTWSGNAEDEGYTATATFRCKNDPSHVQVLDCEVSVEDGVDCDNGGTLYNYASVSFNDNYYYDEYEVEVGPGHKLMPVFHWMEIGDSQMVAELNMVCERGDYNSGGITATMQSTEYANYTLWTATASYDNVEYTAHKKIYVDTSFKDLAVGMSYYINDAMNIGNTTTYFTDDFDGAHRSNMSGTTYLDSVLKAGEDGGNSSLEQDEQLAPVLEYDRLVFTNDLYARMYDDNNPTNAGLHSLGYYEFSWIFTPNSGTLIGVTVVSGSGTEQDPYVLSPIYGAVVTFNANDGIFNSQESNTINQYLTIGSYALEPNENPEADGRLFTGWYTDEYGENKFDFENTPITGNVTLYAGYVYI